MRRGLLFMVLSSVAFGFSGTLATGLLDSGWSPASVVVARVLIGGAVLAVPAAFALRGQWHLLRHEAGLITGYGLVVVAFTQLAYFSAVDHLDVAVALLIEYLAPVGVLAWLWARHGQRPSRLGAIGAAVAIGGLVFVLDLFSGADLSAAGVVWALFAMAGCAAYFLLSARPTELPPVALASSGLLLGGASLWLAGLIGMVPLAAGMNDTTFSGAEVPFWVPLVGISVVSAALAFLLGIIGARMLGARLTSFVALLEVLAAVLIAWLLLGQQPGLIQMLGGLGIVAGVVLVKLGEPEPEPKPERVPVPVA